MAATIVVTPELLRQAAVAARGLAGRLIEVRGRLSSAFAGADTALGDGEARTAFATLRTHWSASSERLTALVHELAAALEAAADSYDRADQEGARASGATAGRAVGGGPSPAVPAGAGHASAPPAAQPAVAGATGGRPVGRGGVDAAAW